MARRFAIGNSTSGNFGTEHSSTTVNNANLSVRTAQTSVAWTASSLSDSDVGFAFYIGDLGNIYTIPRSWTVKLLENNIAVRTETFVITDINSDEDGMYIHRWATPFAYTSLTAGYYKYEISGGGGNADSVMQDLASATNFAYIGFNDSGTTLSNNDTVFIPAGTTMEIDNSTLTLGNGSIDSAFSTDFNWDGAIRNCGILSYDDTGDSKLTIRGTICHECGGVWGDDTTLANVHEIEFDYTTGSEASGSFGVFTRQRGGFFLKGTDREHKALYVSGSGTTASPLIIDTDLSLAVDDYICISATAAVKETEYKYIRSGSFAGGYVLADTAGGVESGLSNTHSTKARVLSLTRNVIITTDDSTKGWQLDDNVEPKDKDYFTKNTFTSVRVDNFQDWHTVSLGYQNCVLYNSMDTTYSIAMTNKNSYVHSDNVFAHSSNQINGNSYLFYVSSAVGQIMSNCVFIDQQVNAWYIKGTNNGLLNCDLLDCNTDNEANGGVIKTSTAINNTIKGCLFDACQGQIFRIQGDSQFRVESCTFGDALTAPAIFRCNVNAYVWDIKVVDSTFKASALGVNMQSGLAGSQIRFHYCTDLPGFTSNEECITYDTNGIYQKCGKDSSGADLDDNTTRTVGNHAFALKPDGRLTWEFNVLARAKDGVLMSGYFKTVNFVDGDLFRAELYLPGSVVPDDIMEWTSGFDYDWTNGFITEYFSGDLPQYARVVVTAESSETDAVVYCADLLNGENDITGLNVWNDAFPSEIMYNISLSPTEVWGMLGSVPVPSNSYGDLISKTMYSNAIWLDVSSSHSGTTEWIIGSLFKPVNNLADALTIANNTGFTKIMVSGTLIASQSLMGYSFESHRNGKIDLNNQLCTGVRFIDLKVYGTQNGTGIFEGCRIDNLQYLDGVYKDCFFLNNTALKIKATSSTIMNNCRDQTHSETGVQFDFSEHDIILSIQAFAGIVGILNSTDADNLCKINFISGKFNFNNTNTAGSFYPRGQFDASNIDTSGGATIVKSGYGAMQQKTNNEIKRII